MTRWSKRVKTSSPEPITLPCDNCANTADVQLDPTLTHAWCMPCREAQRTGDVATFDLRREMLR